MYYIYKRKVKLTILVTHHRLCFEIRREATYLVLIPMRERGNVVG